MQYMDARRQEISLDAIAGRRLPWIETLIVDGEEPTPVPDVSDDLARELSFYQQALAAAKIGKRRVEEAGMAFERPVDFFAEMIKSDGQMERIRQRLLDEAHGMKKSEEARKLRDAKKFGKRVQTQRLLERQAEKSATLEKIASLRKKRGGDDDLKKGGSGGIDDDFTFGEEDAFDVSATHDAKRQKTGTTGSGKSAAAASGKRDYKNSKYGLGGKKRHLKTNTRDSTNDFSFDPRKNKREGFSGGTVAKKSHLLHGHGSGSGKGKSGGKSGKAGGSSRPGKDARKKQRGRK